MTSSLVHSEHGVVRRWNHDLPGRLMNLSRRSNFHVERTTVSSPQAVINSPKISYYISRTMDVMRGPFWVDVLAAKCVFAEGRLPPNLGISDRLLGAMTASRLIPPLRLGNVVPVGLQKERLDRIY